MDKRFSACMKAIGMSALGLALMGNQSCEQQTTAAGPRQLKWYAEAGKITSPSVKFGDAGDFDFGYVASEQLYGVLYNSSAFATSYSDTGLVQSSDGVQLAGAQTMYQKMFASKTVGDSLYYSDEARCLISLPDVRISGSVNAYEMSSSKNISIGFNQSTGVVYSGVGLGGSFTVKVGNLSMQLRGLDVAKDTSGKYQVIAQPLINEKSKDTDGKINISYSQIGVGYSWYNKTPLSVVTERALTNGINVIKTEMNKINWYTKVLDVKPFNDENSSLGDTGYIVKGGSNVNLKKGDQVYFYEDQTFWNGKPCESDFLGFTRFNPNPIAVGEVVYLDRSYSTVVITQRYKNVDIKPGWKVELAKRIEDIQAEAKTSQSTKK